MKKVLFVATVVKKHINTFHTPCLKLFQELGWETNVFARNDFDESDCMEIPYCNHYFDMPFERFPLKWNNFFVYRKLKKLLELEKYNIVHCHTPTGGFLTRLAARKVRKNGTKVIYTAHGFHFYKGAPLINWLIFFPIEWVCSFFTDVLITINQEDYQFAKKYMRAKEIRYVPGVGIDLKKYQNVQIDRNLKRKEIGIPEDAIAVLSVGELNENKNHRAIVEAIAKLKRNDVYYVICGVGAQKEKLEQLAKKLGIEKQLILLGYRGDVAEINQCCDIFAFPSKREGLSLSLMEAMIAELPCVVSDIRGNVDLIENGKGGFLCSLHNLNEFAEKIDYLSQNLEISKKIGQENIEKIKNFSLDTVMQQMIGIYQEALK